MKKLALFGIAVGMLSFVSCKKDYTCTCSTTTSYSSSDASLQPLLPAPTTESATYTGKMKKSESEDWCKANEADVNVSQSFFGTTITGKATTTCSL